MVVNYCRRVIVVKCNLCQAEKYDIDVEKIHFKEISKGSFESWITMDCPCGGTFK